MSHLPPNRRDDRRPRQAAPPRRPAGKPGGKPSGGPPTAWQQVADWYDNLVGEAGSEYHRKVVLPGVIRLLAARPGDAVLDVACGQGVLCRLLAAAGIRATGIDSATDLIDAARDRGSGDLANGVAAPAGTPVATLVAPDYRLGDAKDLGRMPIGPFDAAACVLAIQNIHPIEPVFAGVAARLRPGGRFVVAMMHPCFRSPGQSSWGWDAKEGVQFRRVDRYLLPRKQPIVAHPGRKDGQYTWTFHKPIAAYVKAAAAAGLLVDAIEEWPSHKISQPGARSAAENRAREEIPLFLAIRAVKPAVAGEPVSLDPA